jgi:NAD(P)-dependent dehydrogenase (short-subunit alcohol dehydrogenase family)
MSSADAPVSVVTGANAGIGRATAIHLSTQGHRVIGTVRSVDRAEKLRAMAADAGAGVELVELDVADDDSVRRGFEEIDSLTGRVDHLVNNAGIGGNAVVEECTPELYHEVVNVNVYGAMRCARAVLPQMRARGAGTIVNVSSICGILGAIAQAPYVASKWALEGISQELAQEVAPFGVRVAIIEPGVTRSSLFAKHVDAPNATGAYDAHYQKMFRFYAAGRPNATDPFEVGRVVHHAITTDAPVLRYPVSWGGEELVRALSALRDEDWLELGRIEDLDEYAGRFREVFGLDLSVAEDAPQ